MGADGARGLGPRGVRGRSVVTVLASIAAGVALLVAAGSHAAGPAATDKPGASLWNPVRGELPAVGVAARQAVRPYRFQAFTLDRGGLEQLLAAAPAPAQAGAAQLKNAASGQEVVVWLPDPAGTFRSFTLRRSALMAPGLAEVHPEIRTYRGRGVDDPAATIHADLSPLGFHVSVRSSRGTWYIDPYYHLDQSVYAVYYTRDVPADSSESFVERDADGSELAVDKGYYHATDTVAIHGAGFAVNTAITITISDPEERFASRTVNARSDGLGSFDAGFGGDPGGNLGAHIVTASDGTSSASASYQVVRADDPTVDPPTGDVRRTYRLALITDPGYADYFGGSANVTPAKVALINRVSQIYEDDLSIALQLVANNDLLNLDTWSQAIGPNGPCGTAGCFTQAQVTSCSSTTRARYVIGQTIGASNYDIGHLALGQPGGGVANLGVVGRSNKAGGCTGIPTPDGDFYAIDYVAHEMGHQFSGNHPFNGNQLNCSGGNRNASTSVEPGSGSSVMAYAGICLTDDLQPHSDPYFSQRSLQEISTYTSSSQAAINEVQTASLRHFGGGDEVQVVTFGPGYSHASTIQPLSLAINAAPGATSRGGAEENGNIVTIATGNSHTLQVGDTVTIAGVGVAGYNGSFTVTAVPTSRSFQVTNPVSGFATSGGGTVTLGTPGATQTGTTVTISTSLAHNRSVGDVVVIAGVGVAGYDGTVTITAVPTPRTFQYTAVAGLAASGGGSVTYFSPFQVRIGGNDSAVIGGAGLPYTGANLASAINAITGFAGTVTVTGAASTGFTVSFGGASAGVDVPSIALVNLSCGGCFASVEETNHGGAADSFTVHYGAADSTTITYGVNYSAAGIKAAIEAIAGWPAGATVTIANFGGGGVPSNNGFQVTFGGALAATDVPTLLSLTNLTAGASGFVGETDKGGAVDNKGGIVTATGNSYPTVTAPATYTIPLRTPFALTGAAVDPDGDAMTYSWEQNDRGGGAGTSLLNNTKANGPLFAMFPKSAIVSDADSLLYDSPGENHLTTSPTRVFPDLQQILDNNSNAETGACPTGPIAAPVPIAVKECFSEFLPTADYVGFTGVNDAPLALHFRFTARDGDGGVNSADTTLQLAPGTGPFLVTSPNTAVTYNAGSTQTVTWDTAGTNAAPIGTTDVKISLSTDGGLTYPIVLAASTPNDGSQAVTLPVVGTTTARVKIEAVGNIFFDVSNADFTIRVLAPPTIAKAFGAATVPLGGTTSLTFTIANPAANPTALTGINFSDGLPSGMTVATPNGLANTCGGAVTATSNTGTVALTGATVPAGVSCTLSVNVTGTTAGAKLNTTGIVSATESGPGAASNAATLTVLAPPTIAKAFGGPVVEFGSSTTLSFTVGNPNATLPLTGVGFSDALPAGLVVSTPNGLSGSCVGGTIGATAGSSTVSLTGASIATSGSCTFSVKVTGVAVGNQVNTTGSVASANGGTGGTANAAVFVVRHTFRAPTATGTGFATVTMSTVDGGPTCGFTSQAFVPLSAIPAPPPPPLTDFPHGLFDFTVANCARGFTMKMTFTYPQSLPSDVRYWKFGPTPTDIDPYWYVMPASFSGPTATLLFTDGNLGDDDRAVDGRIVDQGGPGVALPPPSIPTLQQWSLGLLMLLCATMAVLAIRRRRT